MIQDVKHSLWRLLEALGAMPRHVLDHRERAVGD